MYRINKPFRCVKKSDDVMLVNIPRIELSIEINNNVMNFLNYLNDKIECSESTVIDFVEKYDIVNKTDYEELYRKFIELGILVPVE